MRRMVARFTLIEWLVIAGIVGCLLVFVAAVLGGGFDPNDGRSLCMWRGGVPITDASGRLVRCDFPLNIHAR
jgi:hypothetical protein